MKIKVNNKILKTSQTVDCSTICKNITMCEDFCVGFESKSQYIDCEVLGNNGEPITELDDDFRFNEDEPIRSDNEYKRQGEEAWR